MQIADCRLGKKKSGAGARAVQNANASQGALGEMKKASERVRRLG